MGARLVIPTGVGVAQTPAKVEITTKRVLAFMLV